MSALLVFSNLLTSCAASSRSIEYLDDETAATVTSVVSPLVFARSRRDVASGVRDYATVAATTVNRAGRLEHLLLVYFWSTVDPRVGNGGDQAPGVLEWLADDRVIRMPRDPRSAAQAGISRRVHAPAGSNAAPAVYRSDLETLRFIADAGRLRLQVSMAAPAQPYDLWRDGRGQLADFIADVGR